MYMRERYLRPLGLGLATALALGACASKKDHRPKPPPPSATASPIRTIANCTSYTPAGWSSPWKLAAPELADANFQASGFTVSGIAEALRVTPEDVAAGALGAVACNP